MPLIIDQPIGLLPAFEPLRFTVQEMLTTAHSRSPALSVSVSGSSLTVSPETVVTPVRVETVGGSYLYTFDVDVRSEVAALLSTTLRPPLGAPGVTVFDRAQDEITVSFFPWLPDLANNEILVRGITPEVAQPFEVIPAFRYKDEDQGLDAHEWSNQVPNNEAVLPLTRKPTSTLICLDDSEWVPVWSEGMTHFRIRSFDASGALISDGVVATGYGTSPTSRVLMIGVGPANINAIDPADYVQGSPVSITDSTARYLIQIGGICNGGFFLPFIQNRDYYLKPQFCRSARIHFINSFGLLDSFSVWNNYTVEYGTSVFFSERGKSDVSDLSIPSRYRTSAEGRKSASFTVGYLTKQQQQWLARELPMSIQVWTETGRGLEAVHINEGSFIISDTEQAIPELSFETIFSNFDNSQNQ